MRDAFPSTTPWRSTPLPAFECGGISRISPASQQLASLACQALIAEAELTPKPGLVDRRGPGAHHDLSLALMKQSANAIEPYFAVMAEYSQGHDLDGALRSHLAVVGRQAERAMYDATEGSNAHKG